MGDRVRPSGDAELDFYGAQFNALKVLRADRVEIPVPSAPVFSHISNCRKLLPKDDPDYLDHERHAKVSEK